jgi:aminopeptidase-like protein
MDLRRPLKAKNLKVIDYINRLYATLDGNSLWEIDKTSFEVLKMCDGKKTVDEIAEIIAKKIDMKVEDVRPTLLDILKELENLKFIDYVSL